MNLKSWIYGGLVAFASGFFGAIEAGLILIIVDPAKFNLDEGLKRTLLTISVFALLSGIKVSAAYLKTPPKIDP